MYGLFNYAFLNFVVVLFCYFCFLFWFVCPDDLFMGESGVSKSSTDSELELSYDSKSCSRIL